MNRNEAYDISMIFDELELTLIKQLNRLYQDISFADPDNWRMKKLQQIRNFRKSNSKIVKDFANSYKREFKQIMLDEYIKGVMNTERKQQHAIKNGYKPRKQAPPIDLPSLNERKLVALFDSVNHDFDIVSRAILRQADDVYRQTIFKTLTGYNTGMYTLPKAIDAATVDFLEKGILFVTYKNGRKVPVSSYAEMYIRTASRRAYIQGEGDRRKEWGESLVLIASKGVACPKCINWLGKICIDDVYSNGKKGDYGKDYPLISQAIAEGFLHPNCRDTFTGYYEGINAPPEQMTAKEKENAVRIYNLEQRQRYIEQQIRKHKRLAEGSADPVKREKHRKLVSKWQAEQRRFISNHPELRRDYKREKNYFKANN